MPVLNSKSMAGLPGGIESSSVVVYNYHHFRMQEYLVTSILQSRRTGV